MKQYTIGTFASRSSAEVAIDRIHNELDIENDDISYIYRNTDGEVKEVDAEGVSSETMGEGAKHGAAVGGTIGAIAGLATIAGVIPVIGPIFAAGPLLAALGIGAGAVGTTAAGALTGAAAGGFVGALANLGVSEDKAEIYQDQVLAGNVLVAVHADANANVTAVMSECDAIDIDSYHLNP